MEIAILLPKEFQAAALGMTAIPFLCLEHFKFKIQLTKAESRQDSVFPPLVAISSQFPGTTGLKAILISSLLL